MNELQSNMSPAPAPAETLKLGDVRATTQLLERLVADRTLLGDVPEEDRIALLKAIGQVAMPERHAKARLAKAVRRKEKATIREHDQRVRALSQIRVHRHDKIFVAPRQVALPAPEPVPTGPELKTPRHCYVCKEDFTFIHHFYDSMCRTCGDFNYQKRFQTASLEGQVALVTGSRVKIGFHIGLMLLRAGATLVATTRFPLDAARRYAAEPDFKQWSHRLQIHGLDLRHAPSVEILARHLEQTLPSLDILINNAAQTVRRPPGFYAHLQAWESQPVHQLAPELQQLLQARTECLSTVGEALALNAGAAALAPGTTSWRSQDPSVGLRASAQLSMLPYALEQDSHSETLFPQGRLDADLQQVDLRTTNSWRLTLGDVATAEMLEVHLVNAVAPFILCSKLKPLMVRNRNRPGHIVNVSAMEGSFSRGTKTDKHPHTNMAKAALNMLTLTSARDYAKSHIYMNAVDTGWVTDEDPAQHAERKRNDLDWQPPLDIVDGAARVVDPVFTTARTGEITYGQFFKDYRPTTW